MSEQPIGTSDRAGIPWAEARQRLEEAQYYWLATAAPGCPPHITAVLAVWLDGRLYFSSSRRTRKSRNLAADAQCSLAVDSDDLHLTLDGSATRVTENALLLAVSRAYRDKYGWETTVRDSALHGAGAPTAGPPPYEVFEVTPVRILSLGTDETFGATCWRFEAER